MKGNSKNINMTEGSIWKNLVFFAIPILIGNLFQQLYNTADSLIVGNFIDKDALAAVSSSGSLIFLLVGFFAGTASGAGVVISRYFGAKDYKTVERAVHTNIAFGLTAGALLTIIGIALTPQILRWMGTPENVLPNSISYFRIYFLGSIAMVMYNNCMGILQAVGDSRHPLYYLIFSSILNVVLDLLFVGGFGWGVWAAALATIISQFCSAIMCLHRLTKYDTVYKVTIRNVRFDVPMLRQIIHLGLPSGVQNSIIALANIIVQTNINAFGSDAMAGCGSYFKVEGFAFLPITCFAMALTTFIGQNLGAKNYDRAKKGAKVGILCSITLAEVVGVLIFFLSPLLIAAFNDDPAVVQFGKTQARTESLFYCLLALSHCIAAIMRGAGKATVPMFTMMLCWGAIRITYITLMVKAIPVINVIFWAYPLTWGLSSIIFLVYFFSADWVHNFERRDNKHRLMTQKHF
ncbi:MAG: MATE family efflux transporter [Clostridia bacterium]|nr:MATE family efflux transporter [Clostridia bacterium]